MNFVKAFHSFSAFPPISDTLTHFFIMTQNADNLIRSLDWLEHKVIRGHETELNTAAPKNIDNKITHVNEK